MWDELRRQLGPDFAYRPGSWFRTSHKEIRKADGQAFAAAEAKVRPFVIVASHGPNAQVLARSATWETAFSHGGHVHEGPPVRCHLTKDGWIRYRFPVPVPSSFFDDAIYSCSEPNEAWLLGELRRVGAL